MQSSATGNGAVERVDDGDVDTDIKWNSKAATGVVMQKMFAGTTDQRYFLRWQHFRFEIINSQCYECVRHCLS